MRSVLIAPQEETPPPKRRRYPFDGAPQPAVPLTVFKTRRIRIEDEEIEVRVPKPNVDFLYGGTPVVVPLTVFLRKSAFKGEEEDLQNLAKFHRFIPVFGTNPLLIMLGAGPSNRALGSITVTGGAQRLQIFIAGTDVTNCSTHDYSLLAGLGVSFAAQPLHISSQTLGRWSATFDLIDFDSTLSIQLGQTCLIQENGFRYLAGCIISITPEILDGNNTFVIYHVTAADKSKLFDQRVVLAPVYVAGTDAADVIRDLFTNPSSCNPPLQNEFITLNNVPASLGPLSTDILPHLWTVTKLMDTIMDDVAGVWWIDTTSDLNAVLLPDIGSAPFSLDMTTPYWRKASMTTSLFDYRNKQYALSDRNVTPATGTTGITGTPITETWTLPQPLAASLGYLPDAIVTNFNILKVTGLKVNGTDYFDAVYSQTTQPFINFRHTWFYAPNTPFLTGPNVQNTNPFPDPANIAPDPSPGDVIEVSYIAPQQQAQVVTNDPLAPSFGTCGSGVYEAVEQVKGIDSQDDLNAIAQAILARSGDIPKQLTFETDKPELQVGQKLHVDLPKLDLANTDLMITSVDGQIQSGVLQFNSRIRWTVKATNTADLGNWKKWFERLIRRTENATPIPRYEFPVWSLGGGSAISAGLVESNPYRVKNTGLLIEAYAIALNAPTDQDLTLDVVSAAQGSLLSSGPTPLVIPAGSTGLIKITQFLNDPTPIYLYRDDILSVTATYTVNGADPVPAANVTLGIQISY